MRNILSIPTFIFIIIVNIFIIINITGDTVVTFPVITIIDTTSFSSVTSTNVGISPEDFLTFNFNPLATLV